MERKDASAHLLVRQPGRIVTSVALADGVRVGRDPENELTLADTHVSREHASFRVDEGGHFEIVDLDSLHGTVLNGAKVTRKRLREGDTIQLGNVQMTFHIGAEPLEILHRQETVPRPPRHYSGAQQLGLVYQLGRALQSLEDVDAFLTGMLDTVLETFACDRGLVELSEPTRGGTQRIARGPSSSTIVISQSLTKALLDDAQGVIVGARDGDRAAMAVPLRTGSAVLGFLYVDTSAEQRFKTKDLDFLTALAYLTGAAIERAEAFHLASATADALRDASPLAELIGESAPMVALKDRVRLSAPAADTTVLIHGETGTGKEVVARVVHALSPRAEEPFVTMNCAAMPEQLVESTLFGHEKGAFTGAYKSRRGKFLLANRGTLFLDEVGDLAAPAQAKLLRAIELGEIEPLGSDDTHWLDVRVLAASHKDLAAEVEAGRFREDLFYRLNVVVLEVPPLRERGDDVVLLAEAFLRDTSICRLTPSAKGQLREHTWPGNVRELRNEIERAVIFATKDALDAADLRSPRTASVRVGGGTLESRFSGLANTERALIEEAIKQAGGNVSEAARLLGISRIMMRRRLERFGLTAERS